MSLARDEEHSAHLLNIEDRTNGFPQRHSVGVDFVESAEYRALLTHYADIEVLQSPMVVSQPDTVRPNGQPAAEAVSEEEQIDAQAEQPSEPTVEKKEPEITVTSFDELIEYFISVGKRGIAINRYKGLGEMNPDQLWETTMKPEDRTLLQVRAEDDAAWVRWGCQQIELTESARRSSVKWWVICIRTATHLSTTRLRDSRRISTCATHW